MAQGLAVDAGDQSFISQTVMGYRVDPYDYRLKIVNPQTLLECKEREVGEVWLHGASLGSGYYHNPSATEATFRARLSGDSEFSYLRTGDLGFWVDDRLFLTGRHKDLIIVRGVNHYPHDLERTVLAADPGPAYLRAVCFAVHCEMKDRLVVLREVRSRAKERIRLNTIVEQIAEAHAITQDGVYFLPPGSLVRTSSGKNCAISLPRCLFSW